MHPIATNIYLLLLLLAFMMHRAGTFTMENKVKILEFICRIAVNPDDPSLLQEFYLTHIIGQSDQLKCIQ